MSFSILDSVTQIMDQMEHAARIQNDSMQKMEVIAAFLQGNKENQEQLRSIFKVIRKEEESNVIQGNFESIISVKGDDEMQKVYKRTDNRFEIRFTHEQKRHSIYGKTPKECRDKYKELQRKGFKTLKPGQAEMTLNEWLDKWLVNYKAEKIGAETYTNYKSAIKNHLRDEIGNVPLTKLKGFDIQECINKVKANRVKKICHNILTNAFRYAFNNQLIKFNPMLAVEVKIKPSEKRRALTYQEEIDLLAHIQDQTFHTLVIFFIETGVRRSEALTVKWSDIDFDSNRIKINGTKSKNAVRHVPFTDRLKERLKELSQKGLYLFTYNAAYITHLFGDICKKINLQGICTHSLRHTFATRCRDKGIDIKVVQTWLGHYSITLTADIYTDLSTDLENSSVKKLNSDHNFDHEK